MSSIEDPSVGEWFSTTMEDIRNKMLFPSFEDVAQVPMVLMPAQKHILTSSLDACSKKCNDDEMMFETIHTYNKEQKKPSVEEKKRVLSERTSEIEKKEARNDDLIQQRDSLRDEQAKRRELVLSQHRANKDRLKNLGKAKKVFQDRLGLEIRKTHGEKLQFIFRNISLANPDSASTFTLSIKDGLYQIMSSDPEIGCMPDLEKRLQETNNFSAFLANVRKEFVLQARS